MSVSDDIGKLFQRFGGDPARYQEVARDDEAKHAASRWPLLTALDIGQPEHVPGAGRAAPSVAAAAQARASSGDAPAPASAASSDAQQTPAVEPTAAISGVLRAPLFARAHRHASMPPPVDPARQAATRFGPPAGAVPASEPEAPRSIASRPAVMQDESRPARVAVPFTKPPAAARPAISSTPAGEARPAVRAPAAGSILAGMFAGPVCEPATQPASGDLASLFAKLAGAPAGGRS